MKDNSENSLIIMNNVSRYYGELCAVDDISFSVNRGEILGLLGPNGAGKSTTLQMLTGNLAPSNGQIYINHIDILDQPKKAKSALGYLPETPPLYEDLSVDQYLYYCAKLKRIAKHKRADAIDSAKQHCNLHSVSKRLIGNLSKGFQQRVGIAQAILHMPDVIVLDEPTVGLDPIQIREIRELIRALGETHCVILSTHILPEVTSTCDKVLIIHQGKLVFTENIDGLQKRMHSSSLLVGFRNPPDITELNNFDGIDNIEVIENGKFRLHHTPEIDPAPCIVQSSVKHNWDLFELTPEKLSLEEVFVDITTTEHTDIESKENE